MSQYDDLQQAILEQALKLESADTVITAPEEAGGGYIPWLFDFRALLLQPQWLNRCAEIFWEIYGSKYPFQVGGMETAGIPLVSAIVMKGVERGTPVNGFFIRKSRKRGGLSRMVEGVLTDEPIIIVDDLINSGGTLHKQIAVLAAYGRHITDAFVFLAFRDQNAYTFAKDQGVELKALFALTDFGIPLEETLLPQTPERSFIVRWQFKAENPSHHLVLPKSTPAIDEARIYFGSDAGIFYALEQKTGATVWKFPIGTHPRGKGILSSPAIWDQTVYFGAYDGGVYALNASSGEKRWEYADADWVGSSPALAPKLDTLFIGLEYGLFRKRGGVAALSMKTGKLLWRHTMPGFVHSSPQYIEQEGLVVIGSNDGIIYAHDAQTGAIRWNYAAEGAIKASVTYDSKRQSILFGSLDGWLYMLAAQNGRLIARYKMGGGLYSTPLVQADTVYVTSLDKSIYALNLDSWQERWIYQTNGRVFSSPLLAEGSLWVGSNDGQLYELDPKNGKKKTTFQFSERIVNKIVHNQNTGRFFVPTQANELYCLERNPVFTTIPGKQG